MEKSEDLSFLTKNLEEIKEKVESASKEKPNKNQEVTLVAVSKTKPKEYIAHLFKEGQAHFGENYVEEYVQKQAELDQGIKWHFIGHLQSNKVAKILESNIHVLETLDSEKLAQKLDRGVKTRNLEPLKVFLQVKMSEEETKHGICGLDNVISLAKKVRAELTGLNLIGLMCIGQYGDTSVFPKLYEMRQEVCKALGIGEEELQLSMGMSADFEEAILKGSTNVRVGSSIFGARNYNK